jgi:hypothetical protein
MDKTATWEAEHRENAREVFWLNDPTGNLARTERIRAVFERQGFAVRQIEISPHRKPVWIVRLRSLQVVDEEELRNLVPQLLRQADIQVENDDLTVRKTGRNYALVAFSLSKAKVKRPRVIII